MLSSARNVFLWARSTIALNLLTMDNRRTLAISTLNAFFIVSPLLPHSSPDGFSEVASRPEVFHFFFSLFLGCQNRLSFAQWTWWSVAFRLHQHFCHLRGGSVLPIPCLCTCCIATIGIISKPQGEENCLSFTSYPISTSRLLFPSFSKVPPFQVWNSVF